jgi:hypothetical protein
VRGSRYSGGNAAALGELIGKCEGSEIRYGKPWSLLTSLLIKQARAALLAMGSAAASMPRDTACGVSQGRGYPIGCGMVYEMKSFIIGESTIQKSHYRSVF